MTIILVCNDRYTKHSKNRVHLTMQRKNFSVMYMHVWSFMVCHDTLSLWHIDRRVYNRYVCMCKQIKKKQYIYSKEERTWMVIS